jgi:hypothetical protein
MEATLVAQQSLPVSVRDYSLPLLPFLVVGIYLVLRSRKRKDARRLKERRRQAKGNR